MDCLDCLEKRHEKKLNEKKFGIVSYFATILNYYNLKFENDGKSMYLINVFERSSFNINCK